MLFWHKRHSLSKITPTLNTTTWQSDKMWRCLDKSLSHLDKTKRQYNIQQCHNIPGSHLDKMTPTSDKIKLLFHMIRQFQDNSTPHFNKSLFRHNEIFIRKDGVHVRHIKTSIRHVNTGFAHENMTFWNNKTVFRQVSTTFWQDKMNIWPNKTSLRQVLIKCWQANTSIIHNKTLLGKNKMQFNNMRQLWRSIEVCGQIIISTMPNLFYTFI
jgi:hypothetical protein